MSSLCALKKGTLRCVISFFLVRMDFTGNSVDSEARLNRSCFVLFFPRPKRNQIGNNRLSFRLTTFSGMSASDDLTDAQARQMLFDMDFAYNAFNRFLA